MDLKNTETKFDQLVTKYVLAYNDDIRKNYDGQDPYKLLDTFENYMKDKKFKKDCKSYTKPQTEVKQMLAKILELFISELRELEDLDDTDPKIIEKIQEQAREMKSPEPSMIDFIITTATFHCPDKDTILGSENDALPGGKTNYFHEKIQGYWQEYKNSPFIISMISRTFNDFLKVIGMKSSQMLWENHVTYNQKFFLALLRSLNMHDQLLDELRGCIRPKVPAKKRAPKKKETDNDENTENNTNEETNDVNEDTGEEAEAEGEYEAEGEGEEEYDEGAEEEYDEEEYAEEDE